MTTQRQKGLRTLSHWIAAPSRMKQCGLEKATQRPSLSSQNLLPKKGYRDGGGSGRRKDACAEASKVEASAKARLANNWVTKPRWSNSSLKRLYSFML